MEWVETTGPTVEAAREAALDALGVDEEDVEIEVLEAGRSGLFGRIGSVPARVRARVKPISREKPGGDRGRGRGGRNRSQGGRGRSSGERGAKAPAESAEGGAEAPARSGSDGAAAAGEGNGGGSSRNRRRRGRGGGGSGAGNGAGNGAGSGGGREKAPSESATKGSDVTTEEIPVGEQADLADEFVRGLVGAFGLEAEVSIRIDEDTVFVDVEGRDLGLLVGPKGATLKAIEELVRTVVQRSTDGHGARIHVDVAGYQAKRRAALAEFATELAGRVKDSGSELALEPMSASDRKVVHDTIAALDGVTTTSEGEDPRRRVVIRPA